MRRMTTATAATVPAKPFVKRAGGKTQLLPTILSDLPGEVATPTPPTPREARNYAGTAAYGMPPQSACSAGAKLPSQLFGDSASRCNG